jgi:branched-chain amino acid transport system substrate-binding protein
MAECAAMIRRRALLIFLLATVIAGSPSAHAAKRRTVGRTSPTVIRIGALFSLTGDGASLGTASAAALDLAVRDINRELDALHTPYHVESDVEDSRLTAGVALEKIQALHARGARIVIGPQSSAEAAAVLPYANANGIVVISQGSTASSLAIPGDYLFRLAPNDKLEGAAQAALVRADGIDTIVPMWRADAGNGGLHDSTKRFFETAGGTVLPGVSYDPSTTDFTTYVAALGNAVRGVKNAKPSAHIAIYLASFEEAVDIFRLARLDTDLAGLRWYGGDGVTQSSALLADASVAAFAAATNFTAPNVGLDETARDQWQPISDEIRDRIGFAPDAYALSVYDAAWAAILSAVAVDNDAALLRESFVRNIQRYWGLTGPTALDPAGDRKFANFDFWTIRTTNGTSTWVRTAQYAGGHISR